MPLVTVLVPTHSHGSTLRFSVESALAQTVDNLEVLVVGDAATAETRDVARALVREDRRVRFFDFPKGERHGERNRHVALQEARGRLVCYLSDDDLWLREHVAHLCELLERVDFATTVRRHAHELLAPVHRYARREDVLTVCPGEDPRAARLDVPVRHADAPVQYTAC